MKGQWIGTYSGNDEGLAVADIDDEGEFFDGVVYVFPKDRLTPPTLASFRTTTKADAFDVEGPLEFLDPSTYVIVSRAEIASRFTNFVFPETAKAHFERDGNSLKITWTTEGEGHGEATLLRTIEGPSPFVPNPQVKTWEEFKKYALDFPRDCYVFRGQPQPYRLRTSFHRSNRVNLLRYVRECIPEIHKLAIANTSHLFNLADPTQYGAFYALIQHHGYPTPLLDWTRSPFVAAFFAFRSVPTRPADGVVRIYIFNIQKWRQHQPQIPSVGPAKPHFSMVGFVPIDNKRMGPQQSVASVTNLEDIETHLMNCGNATDTTYLEIIDLPHSERATVMRELAIMGITAGSLFPGLDGACEAQREHDFMYANDL